MSRLAPPPPCRSPRCPNRGPGYSPTCQSLVPNQLLVPIHGRGVWLFGKRRDVVDQLRAFFAHGPDVPALGTAVVVSARQFARERQKPARRTVTRWTAHKRGHGWGTTHYPSEMAGRARRESSYRNQCLCSKRLRDRLCLDGSNPGTASNKSQGHAQNPSGPRKSVLTSNQISVGDCSATKKRSGSETLGGHHCGGL